MTQEDKELLLKDLCARLPYGVKFIDILNPKEPLLTMQSIDSDGLVMATDGFSFEIEDIKPYLFPMSSMTEEQKKEYCSWVWFDGLSAGWNRDDAVVLDEVEELIDFYHKNHLDWRGLIPKGLANDATGKNIY